MRSISVPIYEYAVSKQVFLKKALMKQESNQGPHSYESSVLTIKSLGVFVLYATNIICIQTLLRN